VKIIDFGLARRYKQKKWLTEPYGTSYYIAPEVIKKQYNEKCDIWSCGVILHIMLCGYPPFFANTEQAILEKIQFGFVQLNSPEWKTVSNDAKMFVKKLLAYDPKERLSAQAALKDHWLRIMTRSNNVPHNHIVMSIRSFKHFRVENKI